MSKATDRNLLFGVLALQAGLIDAEQLGKAGALWAAAKDRALAEVLQEQGWLTPDDCRLVDSLLERNLQKHGGDLQASLAEAATSSARRALAEIADPVIQASLHAVAEAATIQPRPIGDPRLPPTLPYEPEARQHYTLTRLHARGGIGQVWLARDEALGREVALKEIQPDRADNPAIVARFLEEARIAAQLQHPGIIPVYELSPGTPDRPAFYTMKFIRGRTLADACKQYHGRREGGEAGPLELRELLSAFVTVCQAVGYAHSRGVIHRDLKPANVALGSYGEVLVLDFGLSKLVGGVSETSDGNGQPASLLPVSVPNSATRGQTAHGQVLGTPSYMAPEQAEGRLGQVDARSDIYGLGAILYEILTGRPPFVGPDTGTILAQVVADLPQPPRRRVASVPAALEAICLKALAKRRLTRYQSATALAEDVQRFLADEPVRAFAEPWTLKTRRWLGRHRTAVATAAAAFLVATVTLSVGALLLAAAGKREKDRATEAQAARIDAEQQRDEARRTAYATSVALAQRAWEEGNVPRARALLRDAPTEANHEDLRGFEWYYLSRLCNMAPRAVFKLAPDNQPILGLAFSADGRRLWASNASQAAMWDRATGKVVKTFEGISAMAFSRDGRRVVEGDKDGTVRIRDAGTGNILFSRRMHAGPVTAVALSANGQRVGSCGGHSVKVWDARDGRQALTLVGHAPADAALTFGPQARQIAVASEGRITLFDAHSGKALFSRAYDVSRRLPPFRMGPPHVEMAFLQDSEVLAALSGAKIQAWDTASGKEAFMIQCPDGGVAMDMEFSPDGQRLVLAGGAGSVQVADVHTGHQESRTHQTNSAVTGVTFSPDGRRIASGGVDRTVNIWDARKGHKLFSFKDHASLISRLTFSPDGRWLAVGLAKGAVSVWDTAARADPFRWSSQWCVAMSADGQYLATGGGDRVVWDLTSGRELSRLTGLAKIASFAISSDGRRIAVGGLDGTLSVRDAVTAKVLFTASQKGWVRPVAFSQDSRLLAAAGENKVIKVLDVTTGRVLTTLIGHAGTVQSLAFAPDGNRLASGSADGTVRVWDALTGKQLFSWKVTEGWTISSVAFSPDAHRLAAGCYDHSITVWDPLSGKQLYSIKGHPGSVAALAFSRDSRRLASGDFHGTVKIWEADSGRELLTLDGGYAGEITALAFSRDGGRLTAGESVAGVVIWDSMLPTPLREQRAATALTDGLFQDLGSRSAVLKRLRAMNPMDEQIRKCALAVAKAHPPGDPTALGRRAWQLARQSNHKRTEYDAALECIKEACRLRPNEGELINTLGVTYYRLGDYKDALEALHRAAKLNVAKYQGPHPADLAFLAMAEYRLGHVSESANYLQQLRQRLKEPRWAKNAESWMFLREAEQAAWDLDSRVWNIVQSPQHTEAEYRQALHDLEDACRLMPDNGFIINTLGAAQYRLGQYQEALATLGRSDKINQPAQHGPYPMDVAFRALAEYRLGRVAEAKADLKLLRQRMAQDPWSHKDDFLACFHEVEALLAKAK